MEIDKATGYLQVTQGNWKETGFTADKKKIFVQQASDYVKQYRRYPPIDEIADKLGISIKTVHAHLREDSVFKQDWDEVKARLYQVYTSKLDKKVDAKNGVIPNIMMLKFLERGQFSEGLNPTSSNSPSKEMITSFPDAIDAEIVPDSHQLPNNSTGNNPTK